MRCRRNVLARNKIGFLVIVSPQFRDPSNDLKRELTVVWEQPDEPGLGKDNMDNSF